MKSVPPWARSLLLLASADRHIDETLPGRKAVIGRIS